MAAELSKIDGRAGHLRERFHTYGVPNGELLKGSPGQWIETLGSFARELGFDTFIFWPDGGPLHQLERFAEEVVPALLRR